MKENGAGRFRRLFDIYSTDPLARSIVIATMVLGVLLLARPLDDGAALGSVPFLVLLIANQERFLATIEGLLERRAWLILAAPMLVFGVMMLMTPPVSSDDLLRHIASAFWPAGYSDMYVYSRLPSVDLYPSFDWLVGRLALVIGPPATMWVMQALAFIAFVRVFMQASRLVLAGHPLTAPIAVLSLVLVLSVTAGRLILARPEIFLTIWALAAVVVRGTRGVVVWALSGLALGTGYWLAPIYFPAVALLALRGKEKALAFFVLILAWAAIWWWMTGGAFLGAFVDVLTQTIKRVPGIHVAENASVVALLAAPQMLVLALASLWAARRPGSDGRLLALAGYFALSNQVRYGSLIVPLLVLHLLSALRHVEVSWRVPIRSASVAISVVCMGALARSIPAYADMPRFDLPAGSVVFTGFTEATYATLFFNLGKIRISPGFDIGALDPRVQQMVVELGEGGVDCAGMKSLGFTHVIETTLQGGAPDCLKLEATGKAWRLWLVR